MSAKLSVRHINGHFQSLGGVQLVLQHHLQEDAGVGLNSSFIISGESPTTHVSPKVEYLGLTNWSMPWQARQRMRRATKGHPCDIAIHHSAWEMPTLVDLDLAGRRIWMIHSNYPGIDHHLRTRPPTTDGIIVVSEQLRQMATKACPAFEQEMRILSVTYPIIPPFAHPPSRQPDPERPFRVGYCGRVEVQQKRVDRIPNYLKKLVESGVRIEFEVLGDGHDLTFLREQIGSFSQVTFHGRKANKEYWEILSKWDAIIFFSDVEGTPIALLEAMITGAIPIFPSIGCGGDPLTAQVASELLYPAGDIGSAVEITKRLSLLSPLDRERLQKRAAENVASLLGNEYFNQIANFARQIYSMPKRSNATCLRRNPCTDVIPFEVQRILGTVRQRLSSSNSICSD
mgnify:CR=1 FL=1|jgi:Glycosyltransferase